MVTFHSNPELLRYFNSKKLIENGLMTTTPVKPEEPESAIEAPQSSLAEKLEALKHKLPVIQALKSTSRQRQLFQ